MSGRSQDDYAHERQALDAAHAQNEAGRDAFVALAHTALFAASVSFVGDVAPLAEAIWKPLLIAGWTADVTGLLALTLSFGAARRTIDARRAALNDIDPPSSNLAEFLNGVALWSFPAALLCLFSFVTANVVTVNGRQTNSTKPAERRVRGDPASEVSVLPGTRSNTPAKSTNPWRNVQTLDWCDPSTASAKRSVPCSRAVSAEEVKQRGVRGQPGRYPVIHQGKFRMDMFEKGAIVQLKSGGPKMTVSEYRQGIGDYVVKWFAGSKMESACVSPEALQPYVEPTK